MILEHAEAPRNAGLFAIPGGRERPTSLSRPIQPAGNATIEGNEGLTMSELVYPRSKTRHRHHEDMSHAVNVNS